MSDHDQAMSTRRADKTAKFIEISPASYLELRMHDRCANLCEMFARKWVSSKEIIEILRIATLCYPSLIDKFKQEIKDLVRTGYFTEELADDIFLQTLPYSTDET